ncbi:MAG: multicopper oxidase domain-containing protein [Actinomycetaceae bacterium]|nr:multicopper oxidase domain-containing protein [Actinomycetaceae bacterium]
MTVADSRRLGWAVIAVLAVIAATLGTYVAGHRGETPQRPHATARQATGHTTHLTITVEGMSFSPEKVSVPAGDRLVINVRNNSPLAHDLTGPKGETTGLLAPGDEGTVDFGVVTESFEAYCSVAGHKQMGMVLPITVTGAHGGDKGHATEHIGSHAGAAPSMDALMNDDTHPLVDPILQPAPTENVHKITLRMGERKEKLAGEERSVWTFNDRVPGPTLRGKVGDRFEITLVNEGSMEHGVDFHAGRVAPDEAMKPVPPGQVHTYVFTADHAGAWLYHCSSTPMSSHIAHGMFGAVIIDPTDLEPADREYLLLYSEIAMRDDGASMDPGVVAFNGYPFQYVREPLRARVGEKVRIWSVNAGPNTFESLHIVGAHLLTTWKEGAYGVREGSPAAAQALDLAPAQAGFIETRFVEPGHYPVVNHVMTLAERGAKGLIYVDE